MNEMTIEWIEMRPTGIVKDIKTTIRTDSVLASCQNTGRSSFSILAFPQKSVGLEITDDARQKSVLTFKHVQRLANAVPQTR